MPLSIVIGKEKDRREKRKKEKKRKDGDKIKREVTCWDKDARKNIIKKNRSRE